MKILLLAMGLIPVLCFGQVYTDEQQAQLESFEKRLAGSGTPPEAIYENIGRNINAARRIKSDAEALQGVESFQLSVDVSDALSKMISPESVKTAAETSLRRNSIKLLDTINPVCAPLTVSISGHKLNDRDSHAYKIQVGVQRRTFIFNAPDVSFLDTLTDVYVLESFGVAGSAKLAATVQGKLAELLTRLGNDYLKAQAAYQAHLEKAQRDTEARRTRENK